MSPNLLLLVKKAISPWNCLRTTYKSTKLQNLHFAREPVPGIYTNTAEKKRFLVAIKPNGKRDGEYIFREMRRRNIEREFSEPVLRGIGLPPNPAVVANNIDIHTRHPIDIIPTNRPVYHPECILTDHGPLLHQKTPFGKYQHAGRSISNRSLVAECGVDLVDMNGYKFLHRPIQVKYCTILKRYMFASEIENRTFTAPMCKDKKCVKGDHEFCSGMVERKLFVLDDGLSWIIRPNPLRSKFMKKHLTPDTPLYCIDSSTENLRLQHKPEMERSRRCLEREKGRVLLDGENADYLPLMRYLEIH